MCEMLNESALPFAAKHEDRKSTSLGIIDNYPILVEIGAGCLRTTWLSLASVEFPITEGTERCC